MLEKAHHNKFTLNKEKKTLLTIIPNNSWFFDTKWENENTFSKIKERKRKNREHIKKKEKVGKKREGGKIKERKKKLNKEKRVVRVINCCKWVPFTLAKIKSRS